MRRQEANSLQYGFGGDFVPDPLKTRRETLIRKNAWRTRPPTDRQIRKITQMCIALGINEPLEEGISNRMEARNLIYELRGKLGCVNPERRLKKLK